MLVQAKRLPQLLAKTDDDEEMEEEADQEEHEVEAFESVDQTVFHPVSYFISFSFACILSIVIICLFFFFFLFCWLLSAASAPC